MFRWYESLIYILLVAHVPAFACFSTRWRYTEQTFHNKMTSLMRLCVCLFVCWIWILSWIAYKKQSKAKVSVAVSERRRTRGKAPIFQASASCGSLPLLSTPFCSATMNAAPQSQMGDLRFADQGLNTQTRRAFPGLLSVCGLDGISRLTDETTAPPKNSLQRMQFFSKSLKAYTFFYL